MPAAWDDEKNQRWLESQYNLTNLIRLGKAAIAAENYLYPNDAKNLRLIESNH